MIYKQFVLFICLTQKLSDKSFVFKNNTIKFYLKLSICVSFSCQITTKIFIMKFISRWRVVFFFRLKKRRSSLKRRRPTWKRRRRRRRARWKWNRRTGSGKKKRTLLANRSTLNRGSWYMQKTRFDGFNLINVIRF